MGNKKLVKLHLILTPLMGLLFGIIVAYIVSIENGLFDFSYFIDSLPMAILVTLLGYGGTYILGLTVVWAVSKKLKGINLSIYVKTYYVLFFLLIFTSFIEMARNKNNALAGIQIFFIPFIFIPVTITTIIMGMINKTE